MSVNMIERMPVSFLSSWSGMRTAPAPLTTPGPRIPSAMSSSTRMIFSAISPCASRWTAAAASGLGASNRQKTLPASSLNQYFRQWTQCLSWTARSALCASSKASGVPPGTQWLSMESGMQRRPQPVPATQARLANVSLRGWLSHAAGFFEAEKRAFLRASPQIVCHTSDIAEPGDWQKLDYLGESIIVMRGDDGMARAFANVCRHRGSRLVDGESGCAKVLTCPYHAWSYARDGRLVGVPHRHEYPGLET